MTDSLEIPAGKLDVEGEPPWTPPSASSPRRSGCGPSDWQELQAFYTSAGFSDERIMVYLAPIVAARPPAEPDEDERIEIVRWPLDDLDDAIAQCEDSKSLIALLWLSRAREPRRADALAGPARLAWLLAAAGAPAARDEYDRGDGDRRRTGRPAPAHRPDA